MNIDTPLYVISVGRVRQSGEKGELEMVMRVDEAGNNQKATEVDYRIIRYRGTPIRGIAQYAAYLCAHHLYGNLRTFPRSDGATRSAKYYVILLEFFRRVWFTILQLRPSWRCKCENGRVHAGSAAQRPTAVWPT